MLNGVSDFTDQNRRRSGVRVTVVALSTALDVSRSPTARLPPTQMPDAVHWSLPGARARAHAVYMTSFDDAVSRYVAGSDGQKLIFWVKLLLQLVS